VNTQKGMLLEVVSQSEKHGKEAAQLQQQVRGVKGLGVVVCGLG